MEGNYRETGLSLLVIEAPAMNEIAEMSVRIVES
jgi:hypothetical protein